MSDEVDSIFNIMFQCLEEQKEPELLTLSTVKESCACGSILFVEIVSDGDVVCTKCGIVQSTIIDSRQESSYQQDDGSFKDNSRSCMPSNPLYENSGLGTHIRSFKPQDRFMNRLQKQSLLSSKDRSIFIASNVFDNANNHIGLSSRVMVESKNMFKRFNKAVLTRGRIRKGVMASCIMIACRTTTETRTIDEITKSFDIQPVDFNAGMKHVQTWMASNNNRLENKQTTNQYDSELFSMVTKMNIDTQFKRFIMSNASVISEKVQSSGRFEGKTPIGVIVGIICFIIDKHNVKGLKKSYICEKGGVSVPTVNKIIKMLTDLNF